MAPRKPEQPDEVPTSAEVGAEPQAPLEEPQGPVEPAPPQPQEPATVVLQQPEEPPAVYYGPGGIEAPQGEHAPAEYEPFTW